MERYRFSLVNRNLTCNPVILAGFFLARLYYPPQHLLRRTLVLKVILCRTYKAFQPNCDFAFAKSFLADV